MKRTIKQNDCQWECDERHAIDQWEGIEWARKICDSKNVVYLDCETTGLHGAYLVEIAVLSQHGSSLLNTLIKPPVPCEPGAERVHGITKEILEDAPTFPEIYSQLQKILSDRHVVIYNAPFDRGILENCCLYYNLPSLNYRSSCAMKYYAQYFGEWNSYYGNYKWQKLPGGGHRAAEDARACYELVRQMARSPYCTVEYVKDFPPLQIQCEWIEVASIDFRWKDLKLGYYYGGRRSLKIHLPKFSWKRATWERK